MIPWTFQKLNSFLNHAWTLCFAVWKLWLFLFQLSYWLLSPAFLTLEDVVEAGDSVAVGDIAAAEDIIVGTEAVDTIAAAAGDASTTMAVKTW